MRQSKLIFRSIAVLVLLLGLAALLGFMRIEQRANKLAQLTDVAFLTSSISRSIVVSKDEMGAYRARNYEPELIANSIRSAKNGQELAGKLKVAAGEIDSAWLPIVEELQSDLVGVEQRLAEVRDAPRSIVEEESFLGPRYDFIDRTNNKVVALKDDAATRVEDVSNEGIWEMRVAIVSMVFFAGLVLFLVLWGQRFVARRIVSPVTEISAVSQRLVDGEANLAIPQFDRDDEIGSMSRSLAVMQTIAEELVAKANEQIDAQAEKIDAQEERIDAQRERDERVAMIQSLADRFETMVAQVANEVAATSVQLEEAARLMNENAENSSERIVNATRLLTQTSQGVTGAAAASDEFVMSISEISRQAATSAERAQEAGNVAQEADRAVTDLDSMAGKVSAVVELISRIAQRTNLLALNASIEAARGGEAGRGFAVVASEVKELAMQTARATDEVEEQIRAIQNNSSASAGALSRIAEEVGELQTTSMSIAAAVDQQSVAGQDLARSIDIAARHAESVSADMVQVSDMAMATGTAATQVLDSCKRLGQQADDLRTQVGEFLDHVRAA